MAKADSIGYESGLGKASPDNPETAKALADYQQGEVADDTYSRIFTDVAYYKKIEGSAMVQDALSLSPFKGAAVKRGALMGFLSAKLGRDVTALDYEASRNGFAQANYGKDKVTDDEMFGLVKTSFEGQKARAGYRDQLMGTIALAHFRGEHPNTVEILQQHKVQNPDFSKGLSGEDEANMIASMSVASQEISAQFEKHSGTAKRLYDAVTAQTGQAGKPGYAIPYSQGGLPLPTQGGGALPTTVDTSEMNDAVSELINMPAKDRNVIYSTILLAAQREGYDPKTVLGQLGERLGRTTFGAVGQVTRVFYEDALRGENDKLRNPSSQIYVPGVGGIPLQSSSQMTQQETESKIAGNDDKIKAITVMREISNLAEQVDPIKVVQDSWMPALMQKGADVAVGSVGLMAISAIPYAGPAAAFSMYYASNSEQIAIESPDLDPTLRRNLSIAMAIPEALMDRLQLKILQGKAPSFVKALKDVKASKLGAVGLMKQWGKHSLEMGLFETGVELPQNFIKVVGNQLGMALSADYHKTEFLDDVAQWWDVAPETLVGMMLVGMVGGGFAAHTDIKNGAALITHIEPLRWAGMTEEQALDISTQPSADAAQEKLREFYKLRTPESIAEGVKLANEAAAKIREDANRPGPKITTETNGDGGIVYQVRRADDSIVHSTTEEMSADLMLRELNRNEITKTTRGIAEATEWYDKVNAALSRGEDISKLLLEEAPRTLLADYVENPTKANLERLYETVRSIGHEINTPEQLANYWVEASNIRVGGVEDMVYRSLIRLNVNNATGVSVLRDMAQENFKRALHEGRYSIQWAREQLQAIIPLIDSSRIKGKLRSETDTDVIEAWSDVAVAYMRGFVKDEQLPTGIRGFLRQMATVVKDIFRRSYKLHRLRAEGKLDTNLEAAIADSIGLNSQARVDVARDSTAAKIDGMNYSVSTAEDTRYLDLAKDPEKNRADVLADLSAKALKALSNPEEFQTFRLQNMAEPFIPLVRALGGQIEIDSPGSFYIGIRLPIDTESLDDAQEIKDIRVTIRDHDVAQSTLAHGRLTKVIMVTDMNDPAAVENGGTRAVKYLSDELKPYIGWLFENADAETLSSFGVAGIKTSPKGAADKSGVADLQPGSGSALTSGQSSEVAQLVNPKNPDTLAPGDGANYSISAAEDARYLDLAKDPEKNRTVLQTMVDAAAKGKIKVWRGDQSAIQKFDKLKRSGNFTSAIGFSFTSDRGTAEGYGEPRQFFIDAKRIYSLDYIKDRGVSDDAFGFDEEALSELLGLADVDTADESAIAAWWSSIKADVVRIDNIDDSDIVGIGVYGGDIERKATLYFVKDANQIKSADPVTYDAAGNVIPLSERFNPSLDNINYSISMTVAPVRRDALDNFKKGEMQKRATSAKFIHLKQVIDDVAVAYGVNIEARQPVIGGWVESGQMSLEVPEVVLFDTNDMDLAEEMAAIIGASAPELQSAVMIWKDDDNGTDTVLHFKAKSADGALEIAKDLNAAGMNGFTYDTNTRKFSLVLAGLSTEDVSTVHEFIKDHTEQSRISTSGGTQARSGSARFPSEGDYRRHLQNARSRADLYGQGQQRETLNDVISRAERRVDRNAGALKISAKAKKILQKLTQPLTAAIAIEKELAGKKFDNIRQLGLYLDGRFNQVYGKPYFKIGGQEGLDIASDALVYDIVDGLAGDGSGMGWYDERVQETFRELTKIHPEFATDQDALAVYIGILTSTSQGYTVVQNFKQANRVYESYKKTGRLPADFKFAQAHEPINANLAQIQAIIDEYGLSGYTKFMDSLVTGKALRERFGELPSGVTLQDKVRGNRVLGPKIGSFFNNIRGRFDTITMDLWYTRTMHRFLGQAVVPLDSGKMQGAIAKFRDEIQREGARTYGIDIVDALKDDESTVQAGLTLFQRWARGDNDYTEKGYFKFSDGYKIEKASRLLFAIGGMKGAPQNKSYRTYFAGVVLEAKAKLGKLGLKLTEADMQAIIWYREKNLFARTGVANAAAKPADYLDAVMVLRAGGQATEDDDPADSGGTEDTNYSINTQAEIDRVNTALDGMNRGPDSRLDVYNRAKWVFGKLLDENKNLLDTIKATDVPDAAPAIQSVENERAAAQADLQIDEEAQVKEALTDNADAFLPRIAAAPEGSERRKVERDSIAREKSIEKGIRETFNERRKAIDETAKVETKKIEVHHAAMTTLGDAKLKGTMRHTKLLQAIGELDAILSVLPAEVRGRVGGFSTLANVGTGDRALGKFFAKRIAMIDKELERVMSRDYREAILKALKGSRPKRGDSGVRKSTLGADAQAYADRVLRATLLDNDATSARLVAIEAGIATASPEARIDLAEEWGILNTFGDLENRSADTLAQGLEELQTTLKEGRAAWRIKEQDRINTQRERAGKIIGALGNAGKIGRFKEKKKIQRIIDQATAYGLDHASFAQFIEAVLQDPETAAEWSKAMRIADTGSQDMEIQMRGDFLNALRAAAKAGDMSTGAGVKALKTVVKSSVRALDGRMVTDERISIELAEKIVRGAADPGKLNATDIETLRAELAALPKDTQKEFVTIQRVISRGVEVKLDMTPAQGIQLLLSWGQPDVQDKMRREGWSDESIADIEEITKDTVSQGVLAYLKDFYASAHKVVNPVYANMFGMNMPRVKDYAPTRFLHSKDSNEVGLDGSPVMSGSLPGFAKSRVTHSAPIAPADALTVFQQHVVQTAHWVNFAEFAREVRAVTGNVDLRESIKQTAGEGALRSMDAWVELIEQRGGNKAREVAWLNQMLGSLMSAKAISGLGFNMKSVLMQTDSAMRFMLAMNPKQIFSALANPAQLAADMPTVWRSQTIQRRILGGMNPEVQFLFSQTGNNPGLLGSLAHASMQPLQFLDAAATTLSSAMVFRSAFNEALDAGMGEVEAQRQALDAVDEVVYKFSQPTGFGSKSIVENTSGAVMKTWMMFMSDPRLKTGIMLAAARDIAAGKNVGMNIQRIAVIEAMSVLSHVLGCLYRDWLSDDNDEDIWSKGGFAKAILLAPLQGLFIAGTVSEVTFSKITGGRLFAPSQNPLIDIISSADRAVKNLDNALQPDDPGAMLREWTNILRTIAITPSLGVVAALLNIIKPFVGAYENSQKEEE